MVCKNCVRLALCGCGLHPMDYNNRLSAIMVATMWSHLVAVFADLPAPGPAYDGGQLFKACQKAQKTRYALFMVGIILLLMLCLPFIPFAIAAGNFTPIIILLALSLVWTIGTQVKCIIARRDFIRQLNPQQREFLHAAEQVREIRFHSRRQQRSLFSCWENMVRLVVGRTLFFVSH